MADPERFLDAATAARRLGISRATLYAYVSRGRIRTAADPADPRRRLYDGRDVARLESGKAAPREPRAVAERTLDWGLPVLGSSITLIDDGRLFYRGRDAVRWAETATLEDTARLLWNSGDDDPFAGGAGPAVPWAGPDRAATLALPFTERCQALLPWVGEGRAIAWQRDGRHLAPGAVALLRAMAAAATGAVPSDGPIHRQLADAWSLDAEGADLLRRALVLTADHELNASAFAVRVVASTGASLGACLTAGLSALSGPLHGGTTSLVERLFDEVETSGDPEATVERRLRRGDGLPGFGHTLYPDGDPRAAALLGRLPGAPLREGLVAVMDAGSGRRPNVDFALVALRRALGLAEGAALALFAIGRTAGWLAHALEQHGDARLIRPRARYDGPAPER